VTTEPSSLEGRGLSSLPVLLAAALSSTAAANSQTEGPPHITVPRIARPPQRADFERMPVGEAPHGMLKVEGFVQRFPNDGQAVSERTIVYVGYDPEYLYVVFVCFDREVEKIGAHLLPRDAFPNDEDTVAVHIDTFRDLKHAYGFQVNAYGVQTDGTYTEGQGWDLSWDAVWRSEAMRTDQGYVVLFSIPFKSLRFPSSNRQEWGIFFYRAIARRNEQVYWPACSTRFAARFPQAGILDGIEDVSPGRNLQANPYVASRSFRTLDVRPDAASYVSKSADTSVGLDGKAVVHDSIVLDGTVNPDFSQIESDQPQITVNRPFEVFFPEKRPFFLENATYFNTPIQLLFTRRIADPMLGGRATGRFGQYALGAMVVDDRAAASSNGSRAWFATARLLRDIGSESFVGMFVSDRENGATPNRIASVDGRLKIGANWFAAGQAAWSHTEHLTPNDAAGTAVFASLVGSGRRFNYELDYNDRSPAFRAPDGFIPRVDYRSIDQTYSFRQRPPEGALQAWGPDVVVNRTWDFAGHPLDWSVTPRWEFQWPGTTTLDIYYTAARQTLRPGEVLTPSRIEADTSRMGLSFTSAILPRLIGTATFFAGRAPNIEPAVEGPPTAGNIVDATATGTLRLSHAVMVDLSYLLDTLHDAKTGAPVYVNTITRVRIGDQFTRALALRAIVQYNSLSTSPSETRLEPGRNLNIDLLFSYLASPGTAVYVGANYNLADVDPALIQTPAGLLRSTTLQNTGWQVFTKLSYLLRR
jgi:Domain of unknown function (DUF5916)/Carbohydrate family 9 binding domain-like